MVQLRFGALLLACLLTSTLGSGLALAALPDDTSNLPNLHQVDVNLWRSARPQPGGLAQLKEVGLKVDIDLEANYPEAGAAEAAEAESLGIRFVALPIDPNYPVSEKTVDEALALIADKDANPVLVHCHAGVDRTGMIVGLYRIRHDGWTPAAAYREMLTMGFHPRIKTLDDYFRGRTGLTSP